MDLTRDGAQHLPAAIRPHDLERLEQRFPAAPLVPALASPATRLCPFYFPRRAPSAVRRRSSRPSKTGPRPPLQQDAEQNWSSAGIRTAPSRPRARRNTGLRQWTVKSGIQHVEPPFLLLERMLTLRSPRRSRRGQRAAADHSRLPPPRPHPEPDIAALVGASAPGPVSPNEGDYGSIRRRSSTPPKLPAAPPAARSSGRLFR
jgi:hypothetical protein